MKVLMTEWGNPRLWAIAVDALDYALASYGGGRRPWAGPPAPAAASVAAAPLPSGLPGHCGSLGEAADALLAQDVAGGRPAEVPAWRGAAHHLGQPLDSRL
eukprot:71581-Pyramimonas_sp.AAC.1